jgi:putative component of membrane protein insertase Oxa1/YidC/SpoIIIJ protein YidD
MIIEPIIFILTITPPSSDEILLHLAENDIQFYQNTPARVVNWLLWEWQHVLSPQMGPRCRYRPSCSEYARQAINRYGLAKGTVMAAGRLLRDTGFAERDYLQDEEGWWLDSPQSHW